MSLVARSEAKATPAEPERKSASVTAPRGLPETVLSLQRTAGNAAVARAVAQPAAQAIQRCGTNCGCSTCGGGKDEDLLDEEKLGAGLLRSAVANRSA
jgi:hypothetical protein